MPLPSTPSPSPSPLRWWMISLVFWATVINYLDRQALSVAAPVLRQEFSMSNTEYSRVVFAFLLAGLGNLMGGALSALLMRRGWTADAARKTAVTAFALLMLAAIPAVLVDHVILAIALVAVAMVGYTGSTANMLAFPSGVFPGHMVSSVYGLASMGADFGGMLFTLLTGWMVDRFSYLPVFFMFGLMPLVGTAIIWRVLGPLNRTSAGQVISN